MAAQYHDGEIDLDFVRQRVMSFIAYSKHCSAHRTVEGVLGDLVIDRASVRRDGASKAYAPAEYPAVADMTVTLALMKAAESLRVPHQVANPKRCCAWKWPPRCPRRRTS